jgi:Tol biopolymer transport system component
MRRGFFARCAVLVVVAATLSWAIPPTFATASTWLLTTSDNNSRGAAISASGRYVAFESDATDLVSGDTNDATDIFRCDTETGEVSRVSVDSSGTQATAMSSGASISADGRYVAFSSSAPGLVPGDTNNREDIFVHDCLTGLTTRVSVSSSGVQANGDSAGAAISADGRFAAFSSDASNLVSGDTNKKSDIFIRDMASGAVSRVSVTSSGGQSKDNSYAPSISADGRNVAFFSYASNLVSGDTNARADVFVRDRTAKRTSRVSIDSSEHQYAKNSSRSPSISADGRYVAFETGQTLITTDLQTEIYVRDRTAGTTKRVSGDSFGATGNGWSFQPSISADGRYVAYVSLASNLVPGDTNRAQDVFRYDRVTGLTRRVSVDSAGLESGGDARSKASFAISADGKYVAFEAQWIQSAFGDWIDGVFVCDAAALPELHLVSTPAAPSTMRKGRSYSVYGYLKARHAAGTSAVRIYRYKKNSKGAWVGYGYVTAKLSNYSSYSKYAKSFSLPSTGKWRLRAYAPADSVHPEAWSSGYDYVTVK